MRYKKILFGIVWAIAFMSTLLASVIGLTDGLFGFVYLTLYGSQFSVLIMAFSYIRNLSEGEKDG